MNLQYQLCRAIISETGDATTLAEPVTSTAIWEDALDCLHRFAVEAWTTGERVFGYAVTRGLGGPVVASVGCGYGMWPPTPTLLIDHGRGRDTKRARWTRTELPSAAPLPAPQRKAFA